MYIHVSFSDEKYYPSKIDNYLFLYFTDPRTKDWFLIENNPLKVWCLTALYILFVIYGPKYMQNRRAYDLRIFMIVYNLAMVGFIFIYAY